MSLQAAGHLADKLRQKQLEELLEEVPEVLKEAIKACSAPRHAARDGGDWGKARDSYGKTLRRKWFGRKRGTVRHTFHDILRHIENNDVLVYELGPRCEAGAHAYTPDRQISLSG